MYNLKTIMSLSALALAMALPLTTADRAQAQEVETLGEFRDWEAYSFTENGNKVCYMVSTPTQSQGNFEDRADTYLMVTHRPAQGNKDVVSVIAGYPYKDDSEVIVNIDGTKHRLFTHEDSAWAPDKEMDRTLVQRMKRGRRMVVEGTSARGTRTSDTYSLLGFTAANRAIDKACDQ